MIETEVSVSTLMSLLKTFLGKDTREKQEKGDDETREEDVEEGV